MILDLYAGAGGFDEGTRLAGLGPIVGIDNWLDACRTAQAAGHPRICADVAAYPTAPFAGRVAGLIGAPPCQAWSMSGKRLGETDRPLVHALVDAYAGGAPADAWRGYEWADERSHHAAQPARWVRDLRPDWVCLEQVPPVLGLWRHLGRVLNGWGYRVWAGRLNAADYGVPQTRVRAFLLASRTRRVAPPTPTHYDPRRGTAMYGQPWVSMAAALGWGPDGRPSWTVSAGGTGSGGGVEVFGAHARTEILAYRNGNRDRSAVRPVTEPAPTVHFGASHNKVEWVIASAHRTKVNDRSRPRGLDEPAPTVAFGHADMRWVVRTGTNSEQGGGDLVPYERDLDEPAPTVRSNTSRWTVTRPATTVTTDPRISPPGHHGDWAPGQRQHTDSIKVSVVEAAVLQGFRPDYPWQGSDTAAYTQVGNCVPPPLAAAVLAAASGQPAARDAWGEAA